MNVTISQGCNQPAQHMSQHEPTTQAPSWDLINPSLTLSQLESRRLGQDLPY